MARSRWKKVHNGTQMRSGFETKIAAYLDGKKIKYGYETEKLKYTEPATNRTYKPDFNLAHGIIIEAKGRFTAADRRKMALVIEQNPSLDIRLVFQRDNPISKGSKTLYSTWCDKRGIKYHVSPDGSLPLDWLKTTKRKQKKND